MCFAQIEQKDIEKKIGLEINKIRYIEPHKLREHLSERTGKKFRTESYFPWIGRGNVLRDKLISRDELNAEIDAILGEA